MLSQEAIVAALPLFWLTQTFAEAEDVNRRNQVGTEQNLSELRTFVNPPKLENTHVVNCWRFVGYDPSKYKPMSALYPHSGPHLY